MNRELSYEISAALWYLRRNPEGQLQVVDGPDPRRAAERRSEYIRYFGEQHPELVPRISYRGQFESSPIAHGHQCSECSGWFECFCPQTPECLEAMTCPGDSLAEKYVGE